jgi:hypothetical protein
MGFQENYNLRHEIFDPRFFFHQNIRPGPLIKGLKLFEYKFEFVKIFEFFLNAWGVIDTGCTILAFENRSYLGEFEAEFKKALARKSGAQGVLFDEKKTKGRKSRDAVPLTKESPSYQS